MTKEYQKTGTAWMAKEEAQLVHMFKLGYTLEQMAGILERTPSAVSGRLSLLGLVINVRGYVYKLEDCWYDFTTKKKEKQT